MDRPIDTCRSNEPARAVPGSDKRERALAPDDPATPMSAIPRHDRHVYADLTRRLVPAWSRIVGVSPWWEVAIGERRMARGSVVALYRQQASAFGLSAALKLDPGLTGAERTRACIRTALIRWQAMLDPEGRPVSRRWRASRLWPVVAQQVIRLVDASGVLVGVDLLDDLARHLNWLLRRAPVDAPWINAALIESLACAALHVRDASLLGIARERIPDLLARQSVEGWFRERGGADIGRLSLTLDALVRLYLDHQWEELGEPLERALSFLGALIHPDGSIGGCYGSCETGFLSPYAPERLADRIPESARIAAILRARYAAYRSRVPWVWHDNIRAILGSGIAAAAQSSATPRNREQVDVRTARSATAGRDALGETGASVDTRTPPPFGQREYNEAGLTIVRRPGYTAIVARRRGGALHVRWADTRRVVEYPGVTVVFAHTVRTGQWPGAAYEHRTDSDSMSWRGILLKSDLRRRHVWGRLWRATLGRLMRRRRASVATRFQTDAARGRHRLLHDWFGRDVTFHDDGITIRDQVLSRLPSDAVVLESSIGEERWVDRCGENALTDAPIVVEGGRAVCVTRVYRHGRLESYRVDRHVDLF